MSTDVRQTFDDIADRYDSQRRLLIPCLDEFYGCVVELIPCSPQQPFSIIDLGAGTGLLSEVILKRFPQARMTLIDISENMLAHAQKRLKNFAHVAYWLTDYVHADLPKAEVMISSLSIHHLSDPQKRRLYQKIYLALAPEGIFINADNVKGPTPSLDGLYRQQWLSKIISSGLDPEAIAQALERTRIDRLAELDKQLRWLKKAGFREVDCFYKNFQRAVFAGRK